MVNRPKLILLVNTAWWVLCLDVQLLRNMLFQHHLKLVLAFFIPPKDVVWDVHFLQIDSWSANIKLMREVL